MNPGVVLIGAGVVGRSILKAHIDAGVSVCLADLDQDLVAEAVAELELPADVWKADAIKLDGRLPASTLTHLPAEASQSETCLVIESIAERLDLKRQFFADAEKIFGDDAVLCSNTSTLRIGTIAESLSKPDRFCGMHFFMPVDQRGAVELIRGPETSDATIASGTAHAERIGKQPLVVRDGPGFVVNRLLSPYLNESMLLLCRGVSDEQIERAALRYGMPLSPLELIDWIGTRTMFDSGRVFWQSFPTRLDPAAMLSGLIKSGRTGRATGSGFYDYEEGVRSPRISAEAVAICERYRRNEMTLSDEDVLQMLAIPMWIEAAIACREGTVSSPEQVDLAMQGGLGYDPNRPWLAFFDDLGATTIAEAIERWSTVTACMTAPEELLHLLRQHQPTEAIKQFSGR